MLFLVGLGLSSKDITLGAMEACRSSELFIDRFTSNIDESITSYIEEITGKRIVELSRSDMEESASEIVKRAAIKNVAVLVGGDPLIATTHKILYIKAKEQGVETEVVHANSIIITAIGESGLDFYRFGSACTVPKWSEHYSPVSFYEKIESNMKANEHTMLLLDYDPITRTTLSIREAIDALEKADSHYKKGIITGSTKIIILHNMSRKNSITIATTIDNAKTMEMNGINILIIPSTLAAVEKEAVEARTGTKW